MTNNCELSNNDAIFVELSIAFLGAILLAGFFYWRENKQRKKSDEIIGDAKHTLDEIKPIIEKQGKIIEEQKRAEKFRKIQILNGIQTNLKLCLGSLKYIVQKENMGFAYSSGFKNECERLSRLSISLDTSLRSDYYWIDKLVSEISEVNRAINNYAVSNSFYDPELPTIEKIIDRIEEIIPKVQTFKEKIIDQN